MEAGEENGGNGSLKRQREPLSDSEDNIVSASVIKDGLKRRRLEAAGQENHSPKPSTSGRLAELQTKADTPIIPSVRSRVQLLTQRGDGQRCLSDPGAEGPSLLNKGVKEHFLGKEEFNQRMERFKAPVSLVSPTPIQSPANPCQRPGSDFVSGIQQKLQLTTTPSSKQASLIRQERELELNKLPFQPISENAWLKRSDSDSSLIHERTPADSSSVLKSKRKFCWPPTQLWDQVHGDAEMKDGSFTETLASAAEKSVNILGEGTSPGAPAASEFELFGEGQKPHHDAGLSSHDETNTSEIIDKMFEDVLEYAGEEKDQLDEDHDSGIGVCSGVKNKMDPDGEKERCEKEDEERDDSRNLDSIGDDLLTFPASGILSPLSKSVEAAVTPLRLAATQKSDPPSFLLTPEESSAPPAESAPLYSIDAYRTQRQSKLPTVQSVTPAVQRQTPGQTKPQPSVNTKERIAALNEEASKLQTVINQTLQALSCCTDEEHGRGSLEEAEAEKLLLVSCEKRSALLAEVARLREERSSESEEATKKDTEYISQQPCRGTLSITNIQLPLKVEFVCTSQNRTGRPSHYFFVLIRYGPCNIIATPLATAADAQNGDAISFPTSVTMKDIRSSFEIDVEVYSMSHTSGSSSSSTTDRASSKSRVTPRKLLNTITKSSNTLTCSSSANARRSSNFCLVGSHKITLTSLGRNKFPLDKMKFEGKIRRLLGDEFQEKVPFLSPLEGNIYLKLDSEGHSDVQHQGFLTMFELISGFGVWNRQYFVLEGCNMYYWNHPNEKETKEAEGSISLSRFPSQGVRPVKRELCARPFTFELVSEVAQLEGQNQQPLSKCWFSADTKQERLDWMEKLNQALLDFHTWNRPQPESQLSNPSGSGNLRESIL
ncbi:anillin isoform X2 [Kryptolebias marmoratus]|uniref:anillin isoform X2 n=1 Tax=Kryptolebias marmoratus TaxID=37003 RepID=UPI0007F8A75D|nr:anillin isoform X2 [Kryptolebias marmoratus]